MQGVVVYNSIFQKDTFKIRMNVYFIGWYSAKDVPALLTLFSSLVLIMNAFIEDCTNQKFN